MEAQKSLRFGWHEGPLPRWLLRSNPEVERMEPEDLMVSFDRVGPGKPVISGFVSYSTDFGVKYDFN